MSNNETVVVVVLILAVVIVVAMFRFGERVKKIMIWLPWIKIIIEAISSIVSPKGHPGSPEKLIRKRQASRPWLFRHWRAVSIVSPMLLIILAPVWWWFEQPAPWRMVILAQFRETIGLLAHRPHTPVVINRSRVTLDWITNMVDMRSNALNDRYQDEEMWIVDHYWQYWNTANLQPYLSVNKTYVARGGKIHRMFFLTEDELRNPDVQRMLQAQCQIGKLGEDQTGNGFELWRADPKTVKSREEYEIVSRQFQQLPNSDGNFENFDLIQFNDVLYYSSDFSTDYRVLGSSTWIFEPDQVSKIDVRPLFKKDIAQRISCDPGLGQPPAREQAYVK